MIASSRLFGLAAAAWMVYLLSSGSMTPSPTISFTPESSWDVNAVYANCIGNLKFKVYVYELDQKALVMPFLKGWGETYEKLMQYHGYHVDNMYSWPAVLEEQWRLEGVITNNPEEADMFYIPTHTMDLWMVGAGAKKATGPVISKYMESVIGAVSEAHPYWNRYGGARHMLMEPNDPGRCIYSSARIKEVLMNTTILHPNGNKAADFSVCLGGASQDVIVPPRSVLGGFWKGGLGPHTNSSWDGRFGAERPSKYTAVFSGSIQQGGGLQYSRGSRQYLKQHLAGVPGFDIRERFEHMDDYIESLSSSDFSLHLPGHCLWSPRLYDSMGFGAIPVVIGEYYVLPYEQFIPYDEFVVRVGWNQLRFLPEILRGISPRRRLSMRAALRQYVPFLLYGENAHQATYASLCLKERHSMLQIT